MDRIVRPLGEDPAAATYEAADATGRRLIYTVGTRPAADRDGYNAWARAVIEISAHPNLIDVTLGGVGADGRPFLVSATAERTLSELLTTATPPAADVVLHVVVRVAGALEALHARGLRHGAVCPSTVLLDGDGVVRLAGLDTRAPEMAAPVTPGVFTPPEGQQGPPSDVYALAATAYVSLGGTIPYASAPVEDLPGIPVQVTATLRAAMHPDPKARPGVGLLRDSLAAVVMPAAAIERMEAERVGAQVRAVNDTVVSINLAMSGAAATGIAATAGILAGKAAPIALAQATGPGTAAVTAAKGTGVALVWKVGLGVTAAAVAAGAAVVGVQVANDTGVAAPPVVRLDEPPIKGVDFTSISFIEPNGRADAVQLQNGTYEAKHDNVFDDYSWTITHDPVYADLDGDKDLDAVLVMDLSGYEYGAPFFMAWIWEDGKAVQVPNTGEGLCHVDDVHVADGKVEATTRGTSAASGCYAVTEDEMTTETYTIGVHKGFLAQTAPVLGSPDRCNSLDPASMSEVLEPVTPHLAPSADSPVIEGDFPSISYNPGELINSDGWVNARLTYADESVACGWIELAV
ncbi:hypothetical protein AB0I28_04445 [Phytomonospora sp. NPDC050363]|uniref:hypothetical protein n=1 Tax=Phytomonospora sp. NPDC050363 TaxID=3155642 RepID=UPI0033F2BD6C